MPTMPTARILFFMLVLTALFPIRSFAGPQEDSLETARLLAILLDAGRVTIAKHQDLINTPPATGARFTPALFEHDVLEEFQGRTGLHLKALDGAAIPAMAKPLLIQLLHSSLKTIDSFGPVLNLPAMKYKGLIPATFGTETASRFQAQTQIYLKQTAPEQLIRNPKNKPDAYETTALSHLSMTKQNGQDTFGEVVDGGKTARLLLPLYYGKSCLMCHGEPKGERDITGFAREGAKEGELGGAISVKIPLP